MNPPRNILLGVTGGVAAYKACELARLLVRDGAAVQVVMTPGAARFVQPLTFEALTGRRTRGELFDRDAEAAMGHIELARWADAVAIAPATAHCLARLALGLADDLLTTLCLATEAPLLVAPAMNAVMWRQPAVQAHARALRARGVRVLEPDRGEQACGETGPGRLPEPARLREEILALAGTKPLRGLRALVTAGPTREPLDPARFLSNFSTGRMGCAVADALLAAGAEVDLVLGPSSAPAPAGAAVVPVETAAEMRAAVLERLEGRALLVAAAAVADWRAPRAGERKAARGDGARVLELEPTADILAEVGRRRPRPFLVGFAAETGDLEARARAKLRAKGADLMVANRIGPDAGFGDRDTALVLVAEDACVRLGPGSKPELARQLVARLAEHLAPAADPVIDFPHGARRGSHTG